MTMQMDNNNDN